MSNLIPTSIVDKNGKQTIVHKKQQRAANTRSIPAPAVKKPLKAELVESAARQFAQEYVDSQGPGINREAAFRMIYDDTIGGLKKCSVDTIQKISGPGMNEDRRATLASGIGNGWGETMINDYMNVAPLLENSGFSYKEGKQYLVSLEYFKELDPLRRGKYSEERASQTTAVIKVMAHMDSNPHKVPNMDIWVRFPYGYEEDYVPYISDEKLRELLLTSDYDRDTIVDIITERSIFDADQIIEMLEIGGYNPLSNGAL